MTTGSECGPRAGCAALAPATPSLIGPLEAPEEPGLRAAAAALRDSLRAEAGAGPEAFATIARYEVRAGSAVGWDMTVARVGLGDPEVPRWSRAVLASADGTLDDGSRAALVRSLRSLCQPRRPAPRTPDEIVAIDAHAAADLLRAAASAWPGRRAGRHVAGRTVAVDDPGWWPGGPGLDAAGDPPRPVAIVRDGRIFMRPRGPEAGPAPPTGSLVFDSWRKEPALGWRTLRLHVGRTARWPSRGAVVERVVPVRGRLFVAGSWWDDGLQVGSWGPVPAPGPEVWLTSIVAACGPRALDAEGTIVEIPPVTVGANSDGAPA